MNNLLIVDLSHYETVTDWDKVKEMELDGVYLKATERHNYTDASFNEFRKGFKSIDVPWGAYHFYDHRYTGLVQSSHFLNILNGDWGDLPPCLDFEPKYLSSWNNPPRTGCLSAIKLFMNDVEIKTGRKPIFYTNRDHINYLSPVPDWLTDYDLWFSWPSLIEPNVLPWKSWVMWQFSFAGHIDGIYGAVDMNHVQDGFIQPGTTPTGSLLEWANAVDPLLRDKLNYTGVKPPQE